MRTGEEEKASVLENERVWRKELEIEENTVVQTKASPYRKYKLKHAINRPIGPNRLQSLHN